MLILPGTALSCCRSPRISGATSKVLHPVRATPTRRSLSLSLSLSLSISPPPALRLALSLLFAILSQGNACLVGCEILLCLKWRCKKIRNVWGCRLDLKGGKACFDSQVVRKYGDLALGLTLGSQRCIGRWWRRVGEDYWFAAKWGSLSNSSVVWTTNIYLKNIMKYYNVTTQVWYVTYSHIFGISNPSVVWTANIYLKNVMKHYNVTTQV